MPFTSLSYEAYDYILYTSVNYNVLQNYVIYFGQAILLTLVDKPLIHVTMN